MKLIMMSDLHGHLPHVVSTKDDVVCIAGDVMTAQYNFSHNTPASLKNQAQWVHERFYPWLHSIEAKAVLFTPGNHDWIWMYPELIAEIGGAPEHYKCLIDEGCTIDGIRFWGHPWQPVFFDWAFNLNRDEMIQKCLGIPECDVIISHGPPFGQLGGVLPDGTDVGCPVLTETMRRTNPEIVVCGHIHCGHGQYKFRNCHVYNVAIVDEGYRPIYLPTIAEL